MTRLLVALAALAATSASAGAASLPSQREPIKVAIMTDCTGAFRSAYELDIGGAQAAFYQYAGGKPKRKDKPSAGIIEGKIAGKYPYKIVGYGCGDTTPASALNETRRLMEQLKADIMIGPLSGDEAVAIAKYAKTHPKPTFVIGAASQDPTLQIAPKNVFRYHGDGAQWNAGVGEIVYKKLGWRKAAIIMDDYSFGWTSAAGIIADFCSIGGKIVKRVFAPLNTTDYLPYVQQLPPPDTVDGYFWVVSGGTAPAFKAFEQAYGPANRTQHSGNFFFALLSASPELAPRVFGVYVGGLGTAPGLKTPQAKAYQAVLERWHPAELPAASGYVYNYYHAAWALIQGLTRSGGEVGAALQEAMPRAIRPAYQVSSGGVLRLDKNRQAIQDQYPLQVVKGADGKPTLSVVGIVPNVDQSFGGLFKKTSPPPGRGQPPCKKLSLAWHGKIRVVKNGVVTSHFVK
jgi:branched-chain amino acid transport system substrate-binding protein